MRLISKHFLGGILLSAMALSGARADVPTPQAARRWFENRALPGNRIRLLLDGQHTHRERLRLIRNAQRTIFLSAYGIDGGELKVSTGAVVETGRTPVGRQIMDLLCEKSRAGVDVRMLVDPMGSPAFGNYLEELRDCGIKALLFNPRQWGVDVLLHAMHEKLLIADGFKLIIGGSGYMDFYYLSSRDSNVWHDLDAVVVGPGACAFHNTFKRVWDDVALRSRAAEDQGYPFDDRMSEGSSSRRPTAHDLRNFGRSPRGCNMDYARREAADPSRRWGDSRVVPLHGMPMITHDRPLRDAYSNAFALARHSIKLYAPYFVPERQLINDLIAARNRGVEVHLIVNSRETNDEDRLGMVTVGMYRMVPRMIEAGVKIHLWNGPSTVHRKSGVIDESWTYIGSDNLNARAQEMNTETAFFTDDTTIARKMNEEFDLDLARTRELSMDYLVHDLQKIPDIARFLNALAHFAF